MVFFHRAGGGHGLGDGVAGFDGGEDAFGFGEGLEGVECGGVADLGVLDAAGVVPVAVFGADAGVVEAGGDGVDGGGLAVGVLEDVGQ